MEHRLRLLTLAALVLPLLLGAMPLQPLAAQPLAATAASPAFATAWEERGGLAILGHAITPELWQDGAAVQYFERGALRRDADGTVTPLPGLGALSLQASGRDWRTLQAAPPETTADCERHAEHARTVCAPFLELWRDHKATLGAPITQPFAETSATDGVRRTVQYFEHARLELHDELLAPYTVQLGLLGRWRAWSLFGTRPSAALIQATVSGSTAPVAPFDAVALSIAAPGYAGPAEVRIIDPAGRETFRGEVTLADGAAELSVPALGALGAHAAVVRVDGAIAGIATQAFVLDAETEIVTGLPRYDTLPPRVAAFLAQDTSTYEYEGYRVHGYRSPDSPLLWLRDHVYQALGYRHWERDMTSLLDYFERAQKPNGAFDDYFAILGDAPITGRTEVEADLEYLFVQGVWQAWQATGDDAWMAAKIPAMERGIAYSMGDPLRWNSERGLIRRPLTIDTWDFEYGGPTIDPSGNPAPRHWIDDKTRFGVMHGDNTGMGYALRLMSRISARAGDHTQAASWLERALTLKANLDAIAWNGRFYAHNVLEVPFDIPGVDEAQQLSLSNAYALSREVLTGEQARAIIGEYYRRRQATLDSMISDWSSIDPPFPAGVFGTPPGWGNEPGEYVNGGKMPLVGGELARGAFRWGEEAYGFDILRRYEQLITIYDGTRLWYYPPGVPGISGEHSLATDGWGSSAMLAALIEGAAGILDHAALYRDVTLAPRWAAEPEVTQARVVARYAASYGYVAYRWERLEAGLRLEWTGADDRVRLRLLLPPDAPDAVSVTINGVPTRAQSVFEGRSRYIELRSVLPSGVLDVTW